MRISDWSSDVCSSDLDIIVDAHVRCARELLSKSGAGTIELIGYHGQTVLHRPDRGLTIQIGDPKKIANTLGVDVVADVRQADMAVGGEGAPLVPIYHRSEERRVGKECVSTCRSRWSPYP